MMDVMITRSVALGEPEPRQGVTVGQPMRTSGTVAPVGVGQ